jgi:hypothetical protein
MSNFFKIKTLASYFESSNNIVKIQNRLPICKNRIARSYLKNFNRPVINLVVQSFIRPEHLSCLYKLEILLFWFLDKLKITVYFFLIYFGTNIGIKH